MTFLSHLKGHSGCVDDIGVGGMRIDVFFQIVARTEWMDVKFAVFAAIHLNLAVRDEGTKREGMEISEGEREGKKEYIGIDRTRNMTKAANESLAFVSGAVGSSSEFHC